MNFYLKDESKDEWECDALTSMRKIKRTFATQRIIG